MPLSSVLGAQSLVRPGVCTSSTRPASPFEGQVIYETDTDLVQVYNGSGWKSLGRMVASTNGSVLQVVQVTKTDTFSASLSAGASTDITGLSITHSVSGADNKLLLMAQLGNVASSAGFASCGLAFYNGTSLLNLGDAASNRTRVSVGGTTGGSSNTASVNMPSMSFLHTPGSGSKTYTVRAINIDSSTRTVYVNRSEDDLDFAYRQRAASNFILMEIAG